MTPLFEQARQIPLRLWVAIITAFTVLALPSTALAAEEFEPADEFRLDPWIPIEIFGIDMSINKAVFYVLAASVLACVTLIWRSEERRVGKEC